MNYLWISWTRGADKIKRTREKSSSLANDNEDEDGDDAAEWYDFFQMQNTRSRNCTSS